MGLLTLSTKETDVTFNAWWAQFGRTPESIPRALERTRKQIGGMMPSGYVPPPLRQAPAPPVPPGGPTASLVPRSLSESLDVDGMSESELRAEAAALRGLLAGTGRDDGALREQLRCIEAALASRRQPSPFEEAASLAFAEGERSVAVTPVTLTANQSLDLGAMSDAELHAETLRIQEHVRRRPISDESTQRLFQQLQNIEAELLQRDAYKPVREIQAEAKGLAEDLSSHATGTTADELGRLRLRQLEETIAARAYLPDVGAFSFGPGVIEQAIENGTESRLVEPLSLKDPDQDIGSWDLKSLQVEGARIRFWLAFQRDRSDQRFLEMTDLLHRIEAQIVETMILEVGEARAQDEYVERTQDMARGAQRNEAVAGMLKVRPGAYQNRILFWEGFVPLYDAILAFEEKAGAAMKPVLVAADIVLGFVPVVGEVLGALEAVVGYDLAGNELSKAERWLLAASAIPLAGKAARVVKVGARLTALGTHAAAGLSRLSHAVSAAVKIGEAGEKGMLAIARACNRARRSVAEVIPLLNRLGALSMHQGAIAEAVRLLRALEPLTQAARRGILAVSRVFGKAIHLQQDARAIERTVRRRLRWRKEGRAVIGLAEPFAFGHGSPADRAHEIIKTIKKALGAALSMRPVTPPRAFSSSCGAPLVAGGSASSRPSRRWSGARAA